MSWTPPDPVDFIEKGYRQFLREYLAARRAEPERRVPYSLEMFARDAGVSRSALPNIIQGRERLSEARLNGFCRALKLSSEGERIFRLLVDRDQARELLAEASATGEDLGRRHWRRWDERLKQVEHDLQQELVRVKAQRQGPTGTPYRYLSDPLLALLRELLVKLQNAPDPSTLGKMLVPPASEEAVQEALNSLVSLGMLERDPDGHYSTRQETLLTPPTFNQDGAYEFHRATHDAERQLLELDPGSLKPTGLFYRHSRFFSGVLWVPDAWFDEASRRLADFHSELLTWSDSLPPGQGRLYRSAVRLLPVSEVIDVDRLTPRRSGDPKP